MTCPMCLEPIEDDSKFCKYCGAPVSPKAGGAAAKAPVAESPAASSAPSTSDDAYRDPKQEKQVWQGHPAWRSYYGTWALWALASAVILGAAYKWRAADSLTVKLSWLLVVGAAVALLVREALFVLSLRYRLTTQRLFVHRGIVTRVTDQMELMRVDDVRLKQGIIDRLVNTGDVEVMGSDATDEALTLRSINAPAEVAEALRLHVRGARSKGTIQVESI